MIIPHDQLASDTLDRLLEDFVTRDGTEATDAAVKIAQVRRALAAGRAVVTFDEETGTASIMRREDVPRDEEP